MKTQVRRPAVLRALPQALARWQALAMALAMVLLLLLGLLLGVVGCGVPASSSAHGQTGSGLAHRPPTTLHRGDPHQAPEAEQTKRPRQDSAQISKSQISQSLLDLSDPQIANLRPNLRAALEQAARDARAAGVPFWVTSGWRSRAHQQELLDAAIAKYGSREEALRYVSDPASSRHVTGNAVDVGPAAADTWLSMHGARYGLCQIYANEAWHFELATRPGGRCPELLPDASYR